MNMPNNAFEFRRAIALRAVQRGSWRAWRRRPQWRWQTWRRLDIGRAERFAMRWCPTLKSCNAI